MSIASSCSHVRARVRRAAAVLAMMACGLAATVAMVSIEGPAALAAPRHNVVPSGGSGEPAIVVPTVVHVTSGFATWQVAWIAAGAAILAAVFAVRFDRSRARRLATSL